MKKKISNLLITLLLFTLLLLLIIFSKNTLESASLAFEIWKKNIFPSLFPFFVISDLLINYGFVDIMGELFKKIVNKLFNLPKEASFVIITSMLTGFPSSSKYIKELLDKNKINVKQAEYLLTFTHFSNPLFIIGTIATLLKNKDVAIIIFVSHILGNLIIGILLRPKERIELDKKRNIKLNKDIKFITILNNSILKSLNTLILVLGIITTFLVLSNTICNLINTNDFNKAIISGILEMTQGITFISSLNLSIQLKATIITMFISFGGISIHMQNLGILSNYNIKYKYYLISRIIHSIISGTLVYVLLI